MPQLYWDSIDLGDPVSPLTKPAVTRVQIAKFAGAAQEWSPLHLDDEFAKTAGYGGVFAHGALTLGFAVEAVHRWLENGRVLSSQATFQKLVWPGDVLTAKGVVVNRQEKNGEPRIDIDVWTENQNHDIVMKGQITCLLWRNEKDEKKSKGFPPVSQATIDERRTAKPIPKTDAEQSRAREAQAQVTDRKPSPPQKSAPTAAKPQPVKPVAAPVKAPAPPPVKAVAKAAPVPVIKAPPPPKAPAAKAPAAKAPKAVPVKAPSKPAKAPAKPAAKAPPPKPAAKKGKPAAKKR